MSLEKIYDLLRNVKLTEEISEKIQEEILEAIEDGAFNPTYEIEEGTSSNLILVYDFNAVIDIKKTYEENPPIGTSRFGGEPDLPSGISWPEGTDFFCQINFAEVSKYDVENSLPKKGMLYLFSDSDTQPEGSKVIFSENTENLMRTPYPSGKIPDDDLMLTYTLSYELAFYFSDTMCDREYQDILPEALLTEISQLLGHDKFSGFGSCNGSRFFGEQIYLQGINDIFEDKGDTDYVFQLEYENGFVIVGRKGPDDSFSNGKMTFIGT